MDHLDSTTSFLSQPLSPTTTRAPDNDIRLQTIKISIIDEYTYVYINDLIHEKHILFFIFLRSSFVRHSGR